MTRLTLKLKPGKKPEPLVQQEADFTSEGAPPPGKVGTTPPVLHPAISHAVPHVPKEPAHGKKD